LDIQTASLTKECDYVHETCSIYLMTDKFYLVYESIVTQIDVFTLSWEPKECLIKMTSGLKRLLFETICLLIFYNKKHNYGA